MVIDSELVLIFLVAAIPLSITIAVLFLVFNAGRRRGRVESGHDRGAMRQFLDRFAVWVFLIVLSASFALRQEWWMLAVLAVCGFGFAVLRPLDKRANRQMRGDS